MRAAAVLAALLALAGAAPADKVWAAPPSRADAIKDPDTKAWWQIAETLSSDAMEGRDTGSPGYDRAADIVVQRFRAAGLRPAGDNGTWFQVFKVHESRVEAEGTSFLAIRPGIDTSTRLEFLQQIAVRATDQLPAGVDAPMTFRGYCGGADLADVRGKVVVCFNTKRAGLPSAGQRIQGAAAAGAAGLIQVDDPYFTVEPPRWPAAYARTVSIAGSGPPVAAALPVMTLSAEGFKALIAGSGQDAEAILKAGGAPEPLTAFDLKNRLVARFHLTTRDYTAKNVIGVLPGRDRR